jgi:hypothetical protein
MNSFKPAITRLVEHQGGPVRLCRALGGRPQYQEIQRWMQRGWAASKHIFELEAFLPPGMRLRDLHEDRVIARQAVGLTAPIACAAPAAATPVPPSDGLAR